MSLKSFALASVAGLALAGCAVTEQRAADRDPYAATAYTSARQLYTADQYARLVAPVQRASNGVVLEAISYEGIEGARLAHKLYAREDAEQLDGRCEKYIAPNTTESLADIADLCDVPYETLVAYNPILENISYLSSDTAVEIPGGKASPRGTFAVADALASLYVVDEGDTLSTVASKLNVSASSLISMNPGVQWTALTPGTILRQPVSSASSQSASYAPVALAPAWEGYSGAKGIGASAAGSIGATAHAPYALRPVKSFVGGSVGPEDDISTDRTVVRAGQQVTVTAKAKPGEEVIFYRGARLDKMNEVATARADENGRATARISVPKKADMGGVIFKAAPKGGDALYSERVGVVTESSAADQADENESDDDN